jgi:hypothetical protein
MDGIGEINQHPARRPARRPARSGLVVLNLVLLGGLAMVSFAPNADAQAGTQNTRVRGEYLVVGGATTNGVEGVIYVLDSANREMIVLSWNDSTKSVEGVGYRDLVQDASSDPDR